MLLDKSVIDIIEDIAAENPDRTAVESSEGTLTYGQLWQQSEEIAGRLSASLGDNRKPVMVYGHKNPQNPLLNIFSCKLHFAVSSLFHCSSENSFSAYRTAPMASFA